jgi:hypothetical protein
MNPDCCKMVPMPTESQLQDTALRLRIRQRIEDARLPVMIPERILACYGSGHLCIACDQPIQSTEVEYDCQGRQLCFHLGCHVVWQLECAQARPNLP